MKRGLAIVNMLIFVVIFSILSGVVLNVLSSSTRVLEKDIRRTRGMYAAQAGAVMAIDRMNHGATFPAGVINVPWSYDLAGNLVAIKQVTLANAAGAGPGGTMRVDATCDYTVSW